MIKKLKVIVHGVDGLREKIEELRNLSCLYKDIEIEIEVHIDQEEKNERN